LSSNLNISLFDNNTRVNLQNLDLTNFIDMTDLSILFYW